MKLWEVDIHPAPGQPDLLGRSVAAQAADLGLARLPVVAAYGYLLEGDLTREQVTRLARELLCDTVVERFVVGQVGEDALCRVPSRTDNPVRLEVNLPEDPSPDRIVRPTSSQVIHVLPKPGVTDPVAESARAAIADFHLRADAVCSLRKYWFDDLDDATLRLVTSKILANDSIEQVVVGPLTLSRLQLGAPYRFELRHTLVQTAGDDELVRLSKAGLLNLTLVEMQTIAAHFRELGREPTDVELETIAQTWSEHCSHKTLAGRVVYRDEHGERRFENMLKETIFAATVQIRRDLGEADWCVSVFRDNAGIVRFDETNNVVFKVETHNRPSALEPYGGANTGVGGVIRDTLGTGLGAKPVCNTDVFCFAPPDTPAAELPPGVLHPRRVMRGVVSGVRDYGNRMGIPTVNGAICFDPRYVGNPLVFCGNVGLLPHDKSFKEPLPGDYIVAIGGRTGRDGIHGATFSSAELTSDSERVSGGAVQIGNAITEKMVLDVMLAARDRGLYTSVTDCGAGGFSSAVGEMGEKIGAEVWLDKAPLKYEGLSYTEIWISEAQERMVLSVPPDKWQEFSALCASEGVEATILGEFKPTSRLTLLYRGEQVADLSMKFLHDGRPPVVREAVYIPRPIEPLSVGYALQASSVGNALRGVPPAQTLCESLGATLLKILGSLNVASKEWVIRQYDHEVQGGSVVKPLVGVKNDGPSDAAVLRPILSSRRGLVIGCGLNPRYGDLDPYHMAASAIDEAVRNCVAVGADPSRIAILDNFCWGYTDRPETLGSLVRAAVACHDVAVALGTPFISGKDSLNNEFSYVDASGQKQTISIPPSLLISALGQVDDVKTCVTMDLKEAGNLLYLVGLTKNELGGSHFALVENLTGGQVPTVDIKLAKQTFAALHQAIESGLIRACHDLSEGGLAVAAAEMAFAGGLGAKLELASVPHLILKTSGQELTASLLFSESNTRFLCEVPRAKQADFEQALAGVPHALVGEVNGEPRLQITGVSTATELVLDVDLATLKEAWQAPLRW